MLCFGLQLYKFVFKNDFAGFLKTGNQKNLMGNFGLLDLIAALQWIKENIVAFGGDNYKITIVGHDTGASLANLLLLSPVTKGELKQTNVC